MKPYYHSVDIVPVKGLAYSPVEEVLAAEYASELINFRLTEKPGFFAVRQGIRAFHVLDTGVETSLSVPLSECPFMPTDLGNIFLAEHFIRDLLRSDDFSEALFWVPINLWGHEWIDFWAVDNFRYQSVTSVPAPYGLFRWQGHHGNNIVQTAPLPAFIPRALLNIPEWNALSWDRFLLFAQRKTSLSLIREVNGGWGQNNVEGSVLRTNNYGLVPTASVIYFLPMIGITNSIQQLTIPSNHYIGDLQPLQKQMGWGIGFIHSADWSWVSPNISFSLGRGKPTFIKSYEQEDLFDTSQIYPVTLWGQSVTHLKWRTVVSHPGALQIWSARSDNGKTLWIGYNIGDYVIEDISDLARELQHDEPHVIMVQEAATGRVDPAVLSFDIRINDENAEVEHGMAFYKFHLPKKYGVRTKDNFESGIDTWIPGEKIPHGARKFYSYGARESASDIHTSKTDHLSDMKLGDAWSIYAKSYIVASNSNRMTNDIPFVWYNLTEVKAGVVLNSRSIWGDSRPFITGWTVKNHTGDDYWHAGVSRTMMVDAEQHYIFTNKDFSATPFYDLFGEVSLLNPDVDPHTILEKNHNNFEERTIFEKASDVYVWDSFKVKYRISSGRVRGFCLLTHYDRIWNKDKPIVPKNVVIKEPDKLEQLAPVVGWYYRLVYEYEDGTFSNPSPAIGAPHLLWSIFSDDEIEQIGGTTGQGYNRPLSPKIVDGRETVYSELFYQTLGVSINDHFYPYNVPPPEGKHVIELPLIPPNPAPLHKLRQLWRSLKSILYPETHWAHPSNIPYSEADTYNWGIDFQLITLHSDTDTVYFDGYIGEGFSAEIVNDGYELKPEHSDIILRTKKKFRLAIPLVSRSNFVRRNSLFTSKGIYRLTYHIDDWAQAKTYHPHGQFFYYPIDWWNMEDPSDWGYSSDPLQTARVRPKPLKWSLDRDGWYRLNNPVTRYEDTEYNLNQFPPKYGYISIWRSSSQIENITNESERRWYATSVASAVPKCHIQIMFNGAGMTLSPPMWDNDTNIEGHVLFSALEEEMDSPCKEMGGDREEYLKGAVWLSPWNRKPPIIAAADYPSDYHPQRVGKSVELEIFSVSGDDWDTFFVNIMTPQWDADNAEYPDGSYIDMLRIPSIIRYCQSHADRYIAVKDDVPPQVLERLFVSGYCELNIARSRYRSSSPVPVSFGATRKIFGAVDNNVDAIDLDNNYAIRVYNFEETDYIRQGQYYEPYRTFNVPHIKSRWVPVVGGHTVFFLVPTIRYRVSGESGILYPGSSDYSSVVTLYSYTKNAGSLEYMYDGSIWHIWRAHQWWMGNHPSVNDNCYDCNLHLLPDWKNLSAVLSLFIEPYNGLRLYPVPPLVPDITNNQATSVWRLYGPDWHLTQLAFDIRRDWIWQMWNYVPTQVYYFAYNGDWDDDYEVRWNRPYIALRSAIDFSALPQYNYSSFEDHWLSYGIADLWYNNAVATRDNIDIVLYLEGERSLFVENATAYFTSYHLFRAPRLGLWFDRRLLTPRVRKIHIYRSRCIESNEWHPEEYGYVGSVSVKWKWVADSKDKVGRWVLEEDPYFFDNVPDDSIDFSDNPSKHNSLEFGLSSVTNLTLNERVYYANFQELYYPLGTTTFNTMWGGALGIPLLDPIRLGCVINVEESINQRQYVYDVPPPENSPAIFPGIGSVVGYNVNPGSRFEKVIAGAAQGPQAPAYFTMAVDSSGYYSNVFHPPLNPGSRVLRAGIPSDGNPRAYVVWGIAPPIEDQTGVYLWRGIEYERVSNSNPWNPYWEIATSIEENSGGTAIDRGTVYTAEPLLLHPWMWTIEEPSVVDGEGNLVSTPWSYPIRQVMESAIRWSDIGNPAVIRPANIEFVREGDGSGILALVPTYHGNILAFKHNSVIRLMLAGDFTIARRDQLSSTIGILNPHAWAVHGNIVFFASKSGIYASDDNTIQDISGPIAEEYRRRIADIQDGVPNPVVGLVRLFYNPLYNELYVNIPPIDYDTLNKRNPQIDSTVYSSVPRIGAVFALSIETKTWTTYLYTTVECLNATYNRAVGWYGLDNDVVAQPLLSQARNYYCDSLGRIWNAPIVPSNLSLGGQLFYEGPHEKGSIWEQSIDDYFPEFLFSTDDSYTFLLNPYSPRINQAYVNAWISSHGIREMMTIKKKVREFANILAWRVNPTYLAQYPIDWWEQDFHIPYIRSFMSIRVYRRSGFSGSSAYLPEERTHIGTWNNPPSLGELWVVPSAASVTANFGDRGEVVRFHTKVQGPILLKGWKVLIREAEQFVR